MFGMGLLCEAYVFWVEYDLRKSDYSNDKKIKIWQFDIFLRLFFILWHTLI